MKGKLIYIGLGVLAIVRLFQATSNRLSKNFTLDELTATSTSLENKPNTFQRQNLKMLVSKVLQPIRDFLGRPVIVSSGFRSEAVNRNVGGASNSQHKTGFAADFIVNGLTVREAFDLIKRSDIPYDQLIMEYDASKNKNWIHVSYSLTPRKQAMMAVLTNGVAVYSLA